MSFIKYLEKIKGDSRQAIKVEWLNPDESVNFEFTNSLYDMSVDLSVNYQNGSRRSCTLTLNNDKNQFPINFNNIWIGQKFKLWMGIYLDNDTPYYFPQGVFYVSNPNEAYQPNARTIKINGVDKWAYLDGTLHGKLSGTYQTPIQTDLFAATRNLLLQSTTDFLYGYFEITNDSEYWFEYNGDELVSNNTGVSSSTAETVLAARFDMSIEFDYAYFTESGYDKFTLIVGDKTIENEVSGEGNGTYKGTISQNETITFKYVKDRSNDTGQDSVIISNIKIYNTSQDSVIGNISKANAVDPVPPFLSPYYIGKTNIIPVWNEYSGKYIDTEVEMLKCPYTAKVERGKTYADVLLEYATILCARIYYDVNGRLIIEPMSDEIDDMIDTNKEVTWDYTVDEKTFLGLTQTYNFDKVYNDIIVLGNIVNGKQFKARVQNRNIMSDTCVQRIGKKTKDPLEDNQYYSDKQCGELAMYYAKMDTIMKKSGDINSLPLYHIDVNKLVTVSTPHNNMNKELFLITGFTINSLKTMSLNVTSVNVLKDFSLVGG